MGAGEGTISELASRSGIVLSLRELFAFTTLSGDSK
jgi:hypothetical protein